MKGLIINADDFGSSEAVNEAVETAHRRGVLNSASLMTCGEAAADAVERAQRLPALRVGLHVALVNARPVSLPQSIPDLVDAGGAFGSDLVRAGIDFFFRPGIRGQLTREIRAQFDAFRGTGLTLDHVNFHNHMHLHPTIGRLTLRIGKEYGMKAVRYPFEPIGPYCRASGRRRTEELRSWLFLLPWLGILKRNLARAGIRSNQFVFGVRDSGRMSLDRTMRYVRNLPDGITEIYFHPGVRFPSGDADEVAILTSPDLRREIENSGVKIVSYGEL